MPPSLRRLNPAALLIVAACSHPEPFGTTPDRADDPFQPGDPTVLTLNPLQDMRPSWLPGGSGIIYSFEGSPAVNRDRCLGFLPPGGGTRTREVCNTSATQADSTEAWGSPAVSPSGRLAYTYHQSTPSRLLPSTKELRVATVADPWNAATVHTMPLDVEGTKVDAIGDLHWLSDTRLVYLAQSVEYIAPSPGAAPDTVISGLAVVLVDLVNNPAPAIIPGTLSASSVALGDAAEVILYTLAGDSRVYRHELATGTVTIVHDFGLLGVARGIALHEQRLMAVVGGVVSFQLDPVRQVDRGGNLFEVDLATGQSAPFRGGNPDFLFKHPAIASTGALVAEGYRYVSFPGVGVVVGDIADVLLYRAP